jgi:hypothetical protein
LPLTLSFLDLPSITPARMNGLFHRGLYNFISCGSSRVIIVPRYVILLHALETSAFLPFSWTHCQLPRDGPSSVRPLFALKFLWFDNIDDLVGIYRLGLPRHRPPFVVRSIVFPARLQKPYTAAWVHSNELNMYFLHILTLPDLPAWRWDFL